MKKLLTGIQPSGSITLGNYIGAIQQMVKYQNDYESYIFIADLHAITVGQNSEQLKKNIRSLLAIYLACGIDCNKNTIYLQSDIEFIPAISWLLECNTYYGELSRMTQFKDKSLKNQNFTAGLLTYPVLMAADILSMDAEYVPVGIDQKQHVELARDIADRFNKKYGEYFTIPNAVINSVGTKIADLQTPEKKMSKSSENAKGIIFMLDEASVIRKKIMSATTDSGDAIKYDPETKPGISNLINIYSALTGDTIDKIENKFAASRYGEFKAIVANTVVEKVVAIQEKYKAIMESDVLDKILDSGAEIVRSITQKKYNALRNAVGTYR